MSGTEKGSIKSYVATDLAKYEQPKEEAGSGAAIEYVPLPKLVAEIKTAMGIDEATPLAKAVAEAVEGLGIEADVGGMKTKEKANKLAEEMDLPVRTR